MTRHVVRKARDRRRETTRVSVLRAALGAFCLAMLFPATTTWAAEDCVVVKAGRVHVGDGQIVEEGVIVIRDGRITAVGTGLEVPEGATVIDVSQSHVTPGLIDANARIESTELLPASRSVATMIPTPVIHDDHDHDHAADVSPESDSLAGLDDSHHHEGVEDHAALPLHIPDEGEEPEGHTDDAFAIGVRSSELVTEQSSEVVPHTRVLDAVNLHTSDFDRLLRAGVTTVYVSPDPSAVIGARGAVVRTGGPVDHRVLVREGAVKATIGSEPSRYGTSNRTPSRTGSTGMYARRPNSRMGLTWVFRKAFYDAKRREHDSTPYGSDTAAPEATEVLSQVLAGKVPLRIQARLQRDILTALRLAGEFQLSFTLEEGTEAYRCLDELQQRQIPVVFGPIFETPTGLRARSGEGERSRFFTFRALLDAGIKTALSAQEFREEEGLARQAMYAIRFGVSRQDALRAVTLTPAELLGLDEDLGSVAAGKHADLLMWSGEPFAATSRIVAVMIDGQVVVDQR